MKTFQINKNIEIVCQSLKTRRAFKHTATLIYKGNERETIKICYLNRTWERYEFESVLYKLAEDSQTLSKDEKKTLEKYIKNYDPQNPFLKTVAIVAKMGEVLAPNQKARNDWKARMLKAGLEKKGLIMPDDWNELSEDEKEKRLDSVIKQLEK